MGNPVSTDQALKTLFNNKELQEGKDASIFKVWKCRFNNPVKYGALAQEKKHEILKMFGFKIKKEATQALWIN